ncbi:MAG: dihydroorotate dehydrogenase [Candidatus Zixiibacteriota bacterium]
MNDIDLSVEIAGVRFRNPILTASGTFGYGEEFNEYIDLSKLGGIVTKSVTLNPRPGHPPPRTCETAGGMLNAIGLANVGIERFVEEKIPFLKTLDTNVIVNIAGFSLDEYIEVTRRLNDCDGIAMLEINISCPNVGADGLEFSSSEQSAHKLTSELKKVSKYPLIIKLSPNVTNIAAIAKSCEDAGADALSLINTLVGMGVDHYTFKPKLTNITGGLSGPAIKPVALACVMKVYGQVRIPLIGIGGIMNHYDVAQFFIVGATAVQFGTANFIDPNATIDAVDGLKKYLRDINIPAIRQLVGRLRT